MFSSKEHADHEARNKLRLSDQPSEKCESSVSGRNESSPATPILKTSEPFERQSEATKSTTRTSLSSSLSYKSPTVLVPEFYFPETVAKYEMPAASMFSSSSSIYSDCLTSSTATHCIAEHSSRSDLITNSSIRHWGLQLRYEGDESELDGEDGGRLVWLPSPSAYVKFSINPFLDEEPECETNISTKTPQPQTNSSVPFVGKKEMLKEWVEGMATSGSVEDTISFYPAEKEKTASDPWGSSIAYSPGNLSGLFSHFDISTLGGSPNLPSSPRTNSNYVSQVRLDSTSVDPALPISKPKLQAMSHPNSYHFSFQDSVSPSATPELNFDDVGQRFGFAYESAVASDFEAHKSNLAPRNCGNISKRHDSAQGLRRSLVGSVRHMRKSMSAGTGKWSFSSGESKGSRDSAANSIKSELDHRIGAGVDEKGMNCDSCVVNGTGNDIGLSEKASRVRGTLTRWLTGKNSGDRELKTSSRR